MSLTPANPPSELQPVGVPPETTTAARDVPARGLLSPGFLVTAALLVAAGLGMRPGLDALARAFEKAGAPIRRPLSSFDAAALPSFRAANMPAEVPSMEEVGTSEWLYLQRQEAGTSADSPVYRMMVTYYCDPKDKVPHTPEVCYSSTGAVVESATDDTMDVPELGRVPVRVVHLVDTAQRHQVVAYVFSANCEFHTGRTAVRWVLGRPGARKVYFAKIEAMAVVPTTDDLPQRTAGCKRMLAEALPVLVRDYFPERASLR